MQHSKGFKPGIRPRSAVPQPVKGIPPPRPAGPKFAFAELPIREHDNSANRAHKSLLKGLENRDKESLAEEIAALRKELLETKEAATRVKQEKQRRERDLHLLGKQLEDLKSQQLLNAQQAEKQKKRGGKGHHDEELNDLHCTLQGAAEEEETAEVDEESAQYIGQLQRLKSVLELFRQQQENGAANSVLVEKLRARVQELEAANLRLEEWTTTMKVTLETAHRECVQAKQEAASLAAKGLAHDQLRAEKALAVETANSERRMRETLEAKVRELSAELERAAAGGAEAKRRAADLELRLHTKDEELTQVKIQRERALGELVGSSSERSKALEARALLAEEQLRAARERSKATEARAAEAETKLEALNVEIAKEKHALLENVRAQEQRLQDQIDAMEKQGLQSAETVLIQQKEALRRDRDAIERLGDGHDDVDGDPITGPPTTRGGSWAEPFERRIAGWVSELHDEVARAARDLSEGCARVARAHAEDVRVQAGRSGRQGALMRAQAGTARRREGDAAALLKRLAIAEAAVGAVIQGGLPEIEGAADESLRILTEMVSGSGSVPEQHGTESDVVRYYSPSGAQEVLHQLLWSAKARVLYDVAEFARDLRSVLLSCSPGVGNGLLTVTRRLATVCTNWELAVALICPRLGPGLDDPVEQDPTAAISYGGFVLDATELEAVASRALGSLEEDCGVVVEAVCAGCARVEEETEGLAQLIAAAAEWLVQLTLTAHALTSAALQEPEREAGLPGYSERNGETDALGEAASEFRIQHFQRIFSLMVADLGKRVAAIAEAANRGDIASSIGAVAHGAVLEMGIAFGSIRLLTVSSLPGGNQLLEEGQETAAPELAPGNEEVFCNPDQELQTVTMFGRPVYPLVLPDYVMLTDQKDDPLSISRGELRSIAGAEAG
ncbi:hypothetical protein KFL_003030050 [Klebsormidium nitens]|uniref:Uncharacterized protein n=1 Tax=Klebsormidium nitens TaxID=105231 RepID=A0A1Y1I9L9_KLENI|nr:hypothetical protein KFL_003030050 [Klebsormidium nitens]|eukprot:GAQ86662.1 hypothetical protein KFL_003030050 [Klebsormidium nitens]